MCGEPRSLANHVAEGFALSTTLNIARVPFL
jgi:hypothetical protein